MKKNKNRHLLFAIFSAMAMATLVLSWSCSDFSSNSTQPPKSADSTQVPTLNPKLPRNPTYQDLGVFVHDNPAGIDNTDFPLTPVEVLGVTGIVPEVNIAKYVLSVDGLVDNPLSISYDAILKYPTVSKVVLLICRGVFVDNAEWTGVPVTTFFAQAGVRPEASQITFYGMDGYISTLSLKDAREEGVFLAHTVSGQTLPLKHGFPIRLVLKGKYGSQWVKWVNRMEIK
jgi:DMSO/TMAO reductase YedYZ molybdopterin-dependent catalytic subunit